SCTVFPLYVLMSRGPPSSTLFPYTTLFRSGPVRRGGASAGCRRRAVGILRGEPAAGILSCRLIRRLVRRLIRRIAVRRYSRETPEDSPESHLHFARSPAFRAGGWMQAHLTMTSVMPTS